MVIAGLTGGIGSGKTTVSDMLRERGAIIVDADQVARDVMEPGGLAYDGVLARFGPEVLGSDGHFDRPAIAKIVFSDAAALADLNKIVHPAVREGMVNPALAAGPDDVIILDIALLVETNSDKYWEMGAVIVIDIDPELAVTRLVDGRGMEESDARARIAAQASREERLARSTYVVDNSGTRSDLEAEVEKLWNMLRSLPQVDRPIIHDELIER